MFVCPFTEICLEGEAVDCAIKVAIVDDLPVNRVNVIIGNDLEPAVTNPTVSKTLDD